MSLYHEAADILKTASDGGGSLKSLAFSKKGWRSDRKTLFALTAETTKWSEILSEVVENSDILGREKQLTPTLALLLAHDLLLSRRGVALPSTHGLHAAIVRYKARLIAELTKARLRRGCATIDALRAHVEQDSNGKNANDVEYQHPRWVRVNTIQTTMEEQLKSTFAEYKHCEHLTAIMSSHTDEKLLHIDDHVPNLIAVPAKTDLTKTAAYQDGKLILQDKASCFPAYLLDSPAAGGDVVDACAAPGNKTTHLAAIAAGSNFHLENGHQIKIIGCEKDPARSKTLSKMVQLAGAADLVTIRSSQDFMKLKAHAKEFANVKSLLLDPSCSGSGIIGRDEGTISIHLPVASQAESPASNSKKRKRVVPFKKVQIVDTMASQSVEEAEEEESQSQADEDEQKLRTRLTALSGFQLKLLQHAMSFSAAERITYSTCSVHDEENENVVVKALISDVARERGWRILKRDEQVDGLRRWNVRGNPGVIQKEVGKATSEQQLIEDVADACIRCIKGSKDGTMGFFVAGFVRNLTTKPNPSIARNGTIPAVDSEDEEEWQGFSEDEP